MTTNLIYLTIILLSISLLLLETPMFDFVLLLALICLLVVYNGISFLALLIAGFFIVNISFFMLMKPKREIFILSIVFLALGFLFNILGLNRWAESLVTLFFVLFLFGVLGGIQYEKVSD